MANIVDSVHPDYTLNDYLKWRLTYEGGRRFMDRYMNKLSDRESDGDLLIRKADGYVPAFAKAALNDIKNAIYQRIIDIKRIGGPPTYQEAIRSAVDLELNDMNTFMGINVIIELLVMSRVGVLTDMPTDLGVTLADRGTKRPFIGMFHAENIKSWNYKILDNERVLTSVLVSEYVNVENEFGLVVATSLRYRQMQLTPEGVKVTFHEEVPIADGQKEFRPVSSTILDLPRIPFTIFQIPTSLLSDVADYQIALMNLESSDISFSKKANFPIYYEFFDAKAEQNYKKPVGPPNASDGTNKTQYKSKDREVNVGLAKGRRYPEGTSPPGFTSPNPETLRVSMEKGMQLRDDIYRLVNLTVSNLSSSAESKQKDQGTLESGLSFIGSVLQKGENDIARHWANFEKAKPARVTYPTNYSIETEEQRQKRVEYLNGLSDKLPSDTYRRAIAKQIATITLGYRITDEELQKIHSEIDKAETLTCDPDQIIADHTAGLVSDETASVARGYKIGEAAKAAEDRAKRIKMTLEAQGGPQGAGGARGAPEFGGASSASEKAGKPTRGTADKVIKNGQND